MIQEVRQTIVVPDNGEIVIRVPEMKPGTQAEVIVRGESISAQERPRICRAALVGSCRGMFKSQEEADKFLEEERSGWDR